MYYLQSRYYNPTLSRFINADTLVSTGQGLLGNNTFTYCLNIPVTLQDADGKNAEALQWWTTGMGWLPFADAAVPIGDIIYFGGIIIFGIVTFATSQDEIHEISYTETNVAYGPPSPNNEDDEDDDYYDDDSNFGGKQKVGKGKGNTPGNNQKQNKQFRDATKGRLNKTQQRALHDEISGEGYGFHEIVDAVKNMWVFFVGLFANEDEMEVFVAVEMGALEVVEAAVIEVVEVVVLCVMLVSRRVEQDVMLLYPHPHEYFS